MRGDKLVGLAESGRGCERLRGGSGEGRGPPVTCHMSAGNGHDTHAQ